ncbi:MAG: helix-turn-helix transcriptional regulator [Clostridia bacterium]|nr:helix-turn-helix transcriptional regulator [Clostridia bacterium]
MRPKTKLMQKIIEQGLTFSQIADKLSSFGVKTVTVFQWADGRRVPSARIKKAIAKILGCTVKDIF